MTSYGPADPAARIAQAKYDDILTQYHRQRSEIEASAQERSAQWGELMAEQDAKIEKAVADAKSAEEVAEAESATKQTNSWGAKAEAPQYWSFGPADEEAASSSPPAPAQAPAPTPNRGPQHLAFAPEDDDNAEPPVPPKSRRRRPSPVNDDFEEDDDFSSQTWMR